MSQVYPKRYQSGLDIFFGVQREEVDRSIDMHPKGIDMHPNVSIYVAPNNRILSQVAVFRNKMENSEKLKRP